MSCTDDHGSHKRNVSQGDESAERKRAYSSNQKSLFSFGLAAKKSPLPSGEHPLQRKRLRTQLPPWSTTSGALWIAKFDSHHTNFQQAFRPLSRSGEKRVNDHGALRVSVDVDGRTQNQRGGNKRRKQFSVFEELQILEDFAESTDTA